MKKYKRIFTIVIDSFGAGEMPDAAQYGDEGTDTMGHISQNVDEFTIPNLQKLGIANLHPLKQVAAVERPMGYYTFLKEASTGKDTMTGHWEMMGLHITKPFELTFFLAKVRSSITRPTFHSSLMVISRAISQQRYSSSSPKVSSFPQICNTESADV